MLGYPWLAYTASLSQSSLRYSSPLFPCHQNSLCASIRRSSSQTLSELVSPSSSPPPRGKKKAKAKITVWAVHSQARSFSCRFSHFPRQSISVSCSPFSISGRKGQLLVVSLSHPCHPPSERSVRRVAAWDGRGAPCKCVCSPVRSSGFPRFCGAALQACRYQGRGGEKDE